MSYGTYFTHYDDEGHPVYARCQRQIIDETQADLGLGHIWWPENVPCTSPTCAIHRRDTASRLTRARLAAERGTVAVGRGALWLLLGLAKLLGMLLLAILDTPGAPVVITALLFVIFGPDLLGWLLPDGPSLSETFSTYDGSIEPADPPTPTN